MQNDIIIIIPIYKTKLDNFELFSLLVSFDKLKYREMRFIYPEGLNIDYYKINFKNSQFHSFASKYFENIAGYNNLLLSPDFYQEFNDFNYLLILQTDAIVLEDTLNDWLKMNIDYVGAPWPNGIELEINIDNFKGSNSKITKSHVGNGGLSLRRINGCIELLQYFSEAREYFLISKSSEDIFFSLLGMLSTNFTIPNEIKASQFSMELNPNFYYSVNGNKCPLGAHAWWKYDINFWINIFDKSNLKYDWKQFIQ